MNENGEIKIGLVIMASGLGKRFGGNKLMEVLQDKPLIKWIIEASEGLFDKRVVVTRSMDVVKLCDSLNIDCIYHELPNRNDTVRLGLSSIMGEVDYCFFVTGDQPLISKKTLVDITNIVKEERPDIIRPAFSDRVGTPVGFARDYYDELLHLPEGKGGNFVASKYKEHVFLYMVQNEYELWDIDTRQDFEIIKALVGKR